MTTFKSSSFSLTRTIFVQSSIQFLTSLSAFVTRPFVVLLDCLIVHNLSESIPSHYELQFCSLILSLDALKSVFLTELSAMILDTGF